jgi:hypothetical protein
MSKKTSSGRISVRGPPALIRHTAQALAQTWPRHPDMAQTWPRRARHSPRRWPRPMHRRPRHGPDDAQTTPRRARHGPDMAQTWPRRLVHEILSASYPQCLIHILSAMCTSRACAYHPIVTQYVPRHDSYKPKHGPDMAQTWPRRPRQGPDMAQTPQTHAQAQAQTVAQTAQTWPRHGPDGPDSGPDGPGTRPYGMANECRGPS